MKSVKILECLCVICDENYAMHQQLLTKDIGVLFYGKTNNMEVTQW